MAGELEKVAEPGVQQLVDEPEVGAVLVQALAAAREALDKQARQQTFANPVDVSAETPAIEQQQADTDVAYAIDVSHPLAR